MRKKLFFCKHEQPCIVLMTTLRIKTFIFKTFIKPLHTDEKEQRKESILNVILIGAILFLLVLDYFVYQKAMFLREAYQGIPFIGFSLLILAMCGLLYLSRKGFYKYASYGLIAIFIFSTLYLAVKDGFDVPGVLIGYALIIGISGLLINTPMSLIMTVILSISLIGIGYYQTHMNSPILSWRNEDPDFLDTIKYSATLVFVAFIYYLSNRETEKQLRRAKHSEKILLKERAHLKYVLEKRTKKIQSLQMKRIAELYKHAEFGKLSSGAFHDLLNPLTSMNLIVEDLHANFEDTTSEMKAEMMDSVERVVSTSKRLQTFVNALRKRINKESEENYFDPRREIEEAIVLLAFKIKNSNANIIIDEKQNVSLFGNSIAFYQIIINLISNAIDAVSDLPDERKKITIRISNENDDVRITIEDQGHGIDEKHLPHIFEPFFTTKSSGKGIGLGLSTTKYIVEKEFNGTVNVVNNKEKEKEGTTFIVTLPLLSPLKSEEIITISELSVPAR